MTWWKWEDNKIADILWRWCWLCWPVWWWLTTFCCHCHLWLSRWCLDLALIDYQYDTIIIIIIIIKRKDLGGIMSKRLQRRLTMLKQWQNASATQSVNSVSVRCSHRQSCQDQESFGQTALSLADACKDASEDNDVRDVGKPFHIRAAATGKLRSPVERRVGGTTSIDDDDERYIHLQRSHSQPWAPNLRHGQLLGDRGRWCDRIMGRYKKIVCLQIPVKGDMQRFFAKLIQK